MGRVPLAEMMRPNSLDEVIGQTHLLGEHEILKQIVKNKQPVSLILWGPPGTGKTTLARIIAREVEADFIELSAVTSGKKDVEKVIEIAKKNWSGHDMFRLDAMRGSGETRSEAYSIYAERAPQQLTMQSAKSRRTVLFVDEIHRFNKAQQDAFLPHVESGLITLIGATTENPSFEVIAPLLSRMRVLVLQSLAKNDIVAVLKRALKLLKKTKNVDPKALDYIAEMSAGDARAALGNLELALSLATKVTPEIAQTAAQRKLPGYDKNGDAHYDTISAFIKSMRGSDVRATLYYMSRMLDAGEDPKFIARRMAIFASEDVGLAGNGALSLAVATFQAVERVGLPEASYNLYHCATALARSPKSRELANLMSEAKQLAKTYPHASIPLHLRNAPTKLMKDLGYNKDYKWEANFMPGDGFLPKEITDV